jgi:hypothetical protein
MKKLVKLNTLLLSLLMLATSACDSKEATDKTREPEKAVTEEAASSVEVKEQEPVKLSNEQVENIIRRSYPYVAMYNVNNKFALKQGGWNTVDADTRLKDHTMREIARPNNDTLYIACMLDLRKDPVILDIPAFDSKYVSLMVTGYDHYVNVPLSVTKGDLKNPRK